MCRDTSPTRPIHGPVAAPRALVNPPHGVTAGVITPSQPSMSAVSDAPQHPLLCRLLKRIRLKPEACFTLDSLWVALFMSMWSFFGLLRTVQALRYKIFVGFWRLPVKLCCVLTWTC